MVDSGTNMQAVAIQRVYGRSLLTGFYAAWSVGGIVGTVLVAVSTGRVSTDPVGWTLLVGTVVALCVSVAVRRAAWREPLGTGAVLGRRARWPSRTPSSPGKPVIPWGPLLILGLGVVAYYVNDQAISTWSPIFMHEVLDSTGTLTKLGYAAYLAMTLVSRLAGDPCVRRWGRVRVVRVASLVGAVGLILVLTSHAPTQAVLGFAVAGAGLGLIAPLCFSSAGLLAPGHADAVIARLNGFNYLGAVLGGVFVGLIGNASSLRWGFLVPVVLVLAVAVLAGRFGVVRHEQAPSVGRSRCMTSLTIGARLDQATQGLPAPLAVVDLDALDANATDLVRRAGGTPIRVASKSVRVRAVLQRVLARDGFAGVMAYSLREALWLVSQGVDDVLMGYPTVDTDALDKLAADPAAAAAVTLMVDDPAQVELAARSAAAHGVTVRLCLDVDASLRFKVGPLAAHLGVRRSPVHSAADAGALAAAIAARPGVDVVGVMFYEAQVAGLPDSSRRRPRGQAPVDRGPRDPSGGRRRRRRGRRRPPAGARELGRLRLGGAPARPTPRSPRSPPGSGLFVPTLFDSYRSFTPRPAAFFGLDVVRIPAPGFATAFGGGYIASGPSTKSRQPRPVWPGGLALTNREGAGEVQTPLRLSGGTDLRIGDRVWFRHAKSGEVMERFESVHLVRGTEIEATVPTYRGESHTFGFAVAGAGLGPDRPAVLLVGRPARPRARRRRHRPAQRVQLPRRGARRRVRRASSAPRPACAGASWCRSSSSSRSPCWPAGSASCGTRRWSLCRQEPRHDPHDRRTPRRRRRADCPPRWPSSTSTPSTPTRPTSSDERRAHPSASPASPCASGPCCSACSPATGFAGVMAYSLREALWLVVAGCRRRPAWATRPSTPTRSTSSPPTPPRSPP